MRRLFLSYMQTINELKVQPRFCNTLTTNCTTNVLMHTRVNPGDHAYSWKILLSGYAPLYAYESGRLDASEPFARAETALAHQRRRPSGGPGRRFLAVHSCRSATARNQRGAPLTAGRYQQREALRGER